MSARDWAKGSVRPTSGGIRDRASDWRTRALAAAAMALAVGMVLPAAGEVARKAKPAEAQPAGEEEKGAANDAPKKKSSPAEAEAAVHAAVALLEAGKTELAAQSLSRTLAAGRLPPAIMARALLYRGIAYRQQKKPAQAIADLTSALWLKGGLTEADRASALKQRAAAYQEAGLTESGEAIASGKAAGGESSGSGWNFFGNLFAGPSPPASAPPTAVPTPPPAAPAPPAPPPPAPAVQAPVSTASIKGPEASPQRASGWTQSTQVYAGKAEAPARPDGKFRIQVGMARTHDQAEAMAVKVKSQYGSAVGMREPEIDQAVVGNMGAFYRVRVGPYASHEEGQAACAKLKGSGLDCLVVTQ